MRIFDVIKNETDSLNAGQGTKSSLVAKFSGEDFYDHSQLIVSEAEEAIFIKDGLAVQVFGGGRYTLSTSNFPVITPLRSKLSSGKNAFSCRVYFVNLDHKLELLWGTDSPIQLRDPVLRVQTTVQARGSYAIGISDSKKFLLKLIGNNIKYFTQEELNSFFRSAFLQHIKDGISRHIVDSGKEVLEVCTDKGKIAADVMPRLAPLLDEYGVKLVHFYISGIDIPAGDPSRARLEEAFAQKGAMGILGEDWARQQSAEILRDLANNPGAGGVAASGAGFGLGLAAGSAFNDLANQMLAPLKSPPSIQRGEPASTVSRFAPRADAPEGQRCAACSAPQVVGAKFCQECGAALRSTCPACGTTTGAGARFCSECGAQMGA